jgi:hypothetical protein
VVGLAACDAALSQPSSVLAEHGTDEDAAYATEELAVVSERSSQLNASLVGVLARGSNARS